MKLLLALILMAAPAELRSNVSPALLPMAVLPATEI